MSLPQLLMQCDRRDGATDEAIGHAEHALGRELPDDYKQVLSASDGLEGFIGEDAYLTLWPTSDLASLNEAYVVSELAPGLTLLGTDGGDTGYGFRRNQGQVEFVSIPLIGMDSSAASVIGRTFTELLETLAR